MPEQVTPIGSDAADEGEERSETPPTSTGLPAVDAVLDDLAAVDDLPVDEHLAAFEKAHASLRSALDAEPSHEQRAEPGDPV